jgi:AcrR family transcriptional regulator
MYTVDTMLSMETCCNFLVTVYKVLEVEASPRPYHHGNLRESLLKAAEKALETGGVQSISLRELSRDLKVSHTSPRRHFANKQALLDALAIRGFERFDEAFVRASQQKGQGFKDRLIKMARAYVSFAIKHPALLNLMFEAKHRPDAPRELLAVAETTFSRVPAVFAEAQASGEVVSGNPGRLAIIVFSSLLGLVSISTGGKFKGIPLDRLVAEVVERMISGFRPRA